MKVIHAGPENDGLTSYEDLFDPDDWVIEDRNSDWRFHARLIGMGSSQRETHNHGTTPMNGAPGQALFDSYQNHTRCTACRWSEIYIFEMLPLNNANPNRGRYCVYTLGPSIIEGENTRSNVRWASSGFEVAELCTVRRGERGAPFLPAAHARALAMAAHVDEDIADAYVNRAVA